MAALEVAIQPGWTEESLQILVIAGLGPAIHRSTNSVYGVSAQWIAGMNPAMTNKESRHAGESWKGWHGRFFPSPLVGEGDEGRRPEGVTCCVPGDCEVAEPPHPALRATFSRKGRGASRRWIFDPYTNRHARES